MKRRSVSITGASGFVGWHLVEAFRSHGWAVRALVRNTSKALPGDVESVEAPLTAASLTAAIGDSELLVHCAGTIRAPHEAAFRAVNVDGTQAAVDAANARGARFCLISSLAAGGQGTPERPRRESDPPEPVNAYGRSKVAAEAVVRASCTTPWTIIRPPAVYGPRDRGFLPLFQASSRGWFVLPTPAQMPFTLVDVSDLAAGIVAVAECERAARETFFIGHPQPLTSEDILRTMAAVFERPYRPRRIPPGIVRAAAYAGDLGWKIGVKLPIDRSRFAEFTAAGFVCSSDRVRDVVGYVAPTPFRTGVERTARWYREAGWI